LKTSRAAATGNLPFFENTEKRLNPRERNGKIKEVQTFISMQTI
jgi:hypothetical protein